MNQNALKWKLRRRHLALAALFAGLCAIRSMASGQPNIVGWGGVYPAIPANPPVFATNIVAVDSAGYLAAALRSDGRIVGWGTPEFNYDGALFPGSNYVALACSQFDLNEDVRGVGANGTSPGALGSNYVDVALRSFYYSYEENRLLLTQHGTAVVYDYFEGLKTGATNVVAIAYNGSIPLALRPDGSVLRISQTDYSQYVDEEIPGATNIVAIEGKSHALGLREDGAVIPLGGFLPGPTNIPPSLSNVVALAVGEQHSLALTLENQVVAWGSNTFNQLNVPVGLSNVVAIGCGDHSSFAVVGQGMPFLTAPLTDRLGALGGKVYFRMQASGQLPLSYQWRLNGTNLPGATNMLLALTNFQAAQAGLYSVAVSNALGTNTSREASLLSVPLFIIHQPRSTWALTNGWTNFQVVAKSAIPVSYQWSFNGNAMIGETNPTLVLSNVTAAAGGSYTVVVSNAFGAVTSAVATLTIAMPSNAFSTPDVMDENWFIARFSGIPGVTYAIEWTEDLSPSSWQFAGNFVAPTTDEGRGIGAFQIWIPRVNEGGDYFARYFVRAKRLP